MNQDTNHFKLGLFVLAGIVTALLAGTWLVSSSIREETFTAYSFFDEPVTGLDVGSPVRYRGMTIGSVAGIRTAEDHRFIRVRSEIAVKKLVEIGLREAGELAERGPEIPPDLRARIERNFVTGIAFIQTDFYEDPLGDDRTYPFQVPENTVHAVPSATQTFEEGLADTLRRLPPLVKQLDGFITTAQTKLDELDVQGGSDDARSAIQRIDRILADVEGDGFGKSVAGLVDEMRTAVDTVNRFFGDLANRDGELYGLVGSVRRVADRFDTTLEEMDLPGTSRSMRDLTGSWAAVADDARPMLPELRRTVGSLQRLVDLLERDPGALLHGRARPEDPRRR